MSHKLMIKLIAALDVELLEIKGILSVIDIACPLQRCSADNSLIDGIPRAFSAAALGRIAETGQNS